ncbi:MAG TPA: thioredoxin family protein [Anaerolineaceae bacterium]|nr:thioredoxin family protein [Anaerolineaceae bacterium]
MINTELWEKGLTQEEYIANMDVFAKEMRQRVNDMRITSVEFERLRKIQEGRKLLVLTEASCKDSLMNLPIIVKISDASSFFELRIFEKTNNKELLEFFSSKGLVNIPLCWIMDDDFLERGYWMEKPKKAYRIINDWKKQNPSYQLIKEDTSLSEDERTIKLSPLSEKLLDEMWNWYDTDLQSETVKEIYNILI